MKIGILGGTFDPPHAGHVAIAEAALEELQLDEVLFIPTNRNPAKQRLAPSPAKQRLAMVEALVASHDRFAVSDMEITRGGLSYTVETLAELSHARPAEYWLLMGADALKSFSEWKSPMRILQMARLGVAARPPISSEDLLSHAVMEIRKAVDLVSMTQINMSSTELRKRVALNQNVTPWIAPAVLTYIQANKLYRN